MKSVLFCSIICFVLAADNVADNATDSAAGRRYRRRADDGVPLYKSGEILLKENETVILVHEANICKISPDDAPVVFNTTFHLHPCLHHRDWIPPSLQVSLGGGKFIPLLSTVLPEKDVKKFYFYYYLQPGKLKTPKHFSCEFDKSKEDESPPEPKVCDKTDQRYEVLPSNFSQILRRTFEITVKRAMLLSVDNSLRPKCDPSVGIVKLEFQVKIKAHDEKILGAILGDISIRTRTNISGELPESRFSLLGIHGGKCGRTKPTTTLPTSPEVEKIGTLIGSLFIAGFVIMIIIAVAFYYRQWKKTKKVEKPTPILDSPSEFESEMEPGEVLAASDAAAAAASAAASVSEEGEIFVELEIPLGSAPPKSSISRRRLNAKHPAPDIDFDVTSGLPPAAPSVRFADDAAPPVTPPILDSAPIKPTTTPPTPTLKALFEHPVVVVFWSSLIVVNVFALIVSLTVLPVMQ